MNKYRRVLFDISQCQATTQAKIHGGGEYGKSLLLYLAVRWPDVEFTVVINNRYQDIIEDYKKIDNIKCVFVKGMRGYVDIAPTHDTSENPIVLSMPYAFFRRKVLFHAARVISVVHGLRYIECDTRLEDLMTSANMNSFLRSAIKLAIPNRVYQDMQRKAYIFLLRSQKSGDVIVTASNYTADNIRMLMGTKTPQLVTLYPLSPYYSRPLNGRGSFINSKCFVMLAGGRSEKNLVNVLRALELLANTDFSGHLHVFGVTEWQKKVFYYRFPKSCSFVTFDNYVSFQKLQEYYSSARFLLFPSISEGFGIPPVEAMGSGMPTLVSASSAIPEVCKDAALYLDPRSPFDIANKIYCAFKYPEILMNVAERGLSRYEYLQELAFRMHEEFWSSYFGLPATRSKSQQDL